MSGYGQKVNSYDYDGKCTILVSEGLIRCCYFHWFFPLWINNSLMSLLVIFAPWGVVGQSNVLNLLSSDNIENPGTSLDISKNASFLSLVNLVHITRKWYSVFTRVWGGEVCDGCAHIGGVQVDVVQVGGVHGGCGDRESLGSQYSQSLSSRGVTGRVQRPRSTLRVWLPVLRRVKFDRWLS